MTLVRMAVQLCCDVCGASGGPVNDDEQRPAKLPGWCFVEIGREGVDVCPDCALRIVSFGDLARGLWRVKR